MTSKEKRIQKRLRLAGLPDWNDHAAWRLLAAKRYELKDIEYLAEEDALAPIEIEDVW